MPYSHREFLVELGAKLRKMRVERGWSLRDMIVLHGYHVAHWQRFEAGQGISVKSLLRIADTFGMRLEELVSGVGTDGKPENQPSPEVPPAPKTRGKGKRPPATARSTA